MCLFVTLVLFGLSATAFARPLALRVASDNNYPPFLFVGPNGHPHGYEVDLWHLWQKKTGIHVILEPMQWSAAQKAVRDGKADVLDMAFRTPRRDKLYRFSRPYATLTAAIYVDRRIRGLRTPASLRGFQIGVERGDACVSHLHALGLTTLSLYPNYDAIIAAARAGRIKIFCMDEGPANYYLYRNRDQLRFVKAFPLYTGKFHWAVRRGNAATFARVARGMKLITPTERAALRQKWFASPIEFKPYVRIISLVLLASLIGFALLTLWIWTLRRSVRAKTTQLRDTNETLANHAHRLEVDDARLRSLFDNAPDALWMKDPDGTYIECNTQAAALLGVTRESAVGRKDVDLLRDPHFARLIDELDRRVNQTGTMQHLEDCIATKDGTRREFELIKVPIHAANGTLAGLLGIARDITERKRIERELRIAAAAFESQEAILVTDANHLIQRINTAFTELTGYCAEEVIGQTSNVIHSDAQEPNFYASLWETVDRENFWSGELWSKKKNGELFFAHLTISAVRDAQDQLQHHVVTMHDRTAEIVAHNRIEQLTNFDALTNLPNRSQFEQYITDVMASSRPEERACGAVILIGLDDFTLINNVHGHKIGDRVLQETAKRLQRLATQCNILARFTGDEFAVFTYGNECEPTTVAHAAGTLANVLREQLHSPYAVTESQPIVCTASVGVTLISEHWRATETLLAEAELALQKAKSAGKNAVCLFESEMQQELNTRNALISDMRDGLARQEFTLFYQAQVERNGTVTGAEALLRWIHPRRGTVSPCEFIPIAEQTGLIVPLGQWVIEQACRQLALWSKDPQTRRLTVSVNVSTRQFQQADFVEMVERSLTLSAANANQLKLEITESLVMEDIDTAVAKLRALKRRGVRISLDDFGTGSSSLSYLTQLPLDQLKIDKLFVRDLPDAKNASLVAQTIIGLARGMGLEVVAEGVETQAQYHFLSAHGCHVFQGYFFAVPVPCAEFERTVTAEQPPISLKSPDTRTQLGAIKILATPQASFGRTAR